VTDPAKLHRGHQARAATFENPTAAPGAGGQSADGRKGAPSRVIAPGERVRLAELNAGPGRVTHVWATFRAVGAPTTPRVARSQLLEVAYPEAPGPSVRVPAPDFFGAVHGVRTPYASALTAANEALGYTSRVPMPFRAGITVDWETRAAVPVTLYYPVDLRLGEEGGDVGFLHAAFRRENPTTPRRDFVVTDGLVGPGRFLGWTGGVRVFEPERWWGEGEVKFYIDGDGDGDGDWPTICGTGTEDYLDSAWGLGTFAAPETGAPAVFAADGGPDHHHHLVSFYRWHLSDPVPFERDLRVTIQQIGAASFAREEDDAYRAFRASREVAGQGWVEQDAGPALAFGLYERADDWCATAFTYCSEAQAVPACDLDTAVADLIESRRGLRLVVRG
jgi:hypothetical protein